MGSLVKSVTAERKSEQATRIRISMPSAVPERSGRREIWSRGPVYKQLDSDFLQRPLIPRAPLPPRLSIDKVNGRLRVIDTGDIPTFAKTLESVSVIEQEKPAKARPVEPKTPHKTSLKFQVLAILLGFAAGFIAAILFGWL